jgi:inosine-uridine nucleoside N-ribohydrolase
LGREEPLQKTNEFPAAWRKTTDELLTGLPMARSKPVKEDSVAYYSRRKFAETTVLALGPLTNLAAAIGKGARFSKIVLMGGAVRVPGNLGDGGYFKTDNKTAEWNIFCDPKAAGIVFSSGAEIRMVPLDVTNQVPVTETFLNTFRAEVRSALGRLVGEILERDRTVIREGIYYAWDPLAAAGLVDDAVVRWRPLRIAVKSDGTTAETAAGGTVVSTALYADPLRFRHLLIQALQ